MTFLLGALTRSSRWVSVLITNTAMRAAADLGDEGARLTKTSASSNACLSGSKLTANVTAKRLESGRLPGRDRMKFLNNRPVASTAHACPDFVISRSPVQVGS